MSGETPVVALKHLDGDVYIIWCNVMDGDTPYAGLAWYQGKSVLFQKSRAGQVGAKARFILQSLTPEARQIVRANHAQFRQTVGYLRDYDPQYQEQRWVIPDGQTMFTPSQALDTSALPMLGWCSLGQIVNPYPHSPVGEEIWVDIRAEA